MNSEGKHADRDTKGDNEIPTKGQLLWNVNTSLAYGAKGIQYFPLIQPYWFAYAPDRGYDYDRNGLIGADGSSTKWYGYAQIANRQVAAVDDVLLHAISKEILAIGNSAQSDTKIIQDSYGVLGSVVVSNPEQGAIIGVFDYQGKEVFYIVNYDVVTEQMVTLKFNSTIRYRIVSATINENHIGDAYTLKLKAGDAILVVVE